MSSSCVNSNLSVLSDACQQHGIVYVMRVSVSVSVLCPSLSVHRGYPTNLTLTSNPLWS